MASDWRLLGAVELEDESAVTVERCDGLVRLTVLSDDNYDGESAVLGSEALDMLRELLDRAAMPGQDHPQ